MNKKYFIFSIVVLWLLGAGFVQAVALKVSPAEIAVEAGLGQIIEKQIIVENPNDNVALYEVYADNFSDWIKLSPASFVLEAGQTKKVAVEVQAKGQGLFSTNLSVLAKPLSGNAVRANSGVKIPLVLKITEPRNNHFTAALFGIINGWFASPLFSFLLGMVLVLLIWRFSCWQKKKMVE